MEFKRKTIRLKDGREAVIRGAQPSDAAEMAAFMKTTAGETDFLLRYPEECTMTEAGEAVFLDDVLNSPDQVMPCCFVDGVLAGNAMLTMNSRIKTRHRASVAIGLKKEYWGLGIGRALMDACIECAKRAGYAQLELTVVAENARAVEMYRRAGFVEFGRNPRGFNSRLSGYQELVSMRLEL